MKEKFKKFGKLSLSKELTRDEQKEVLGGARANICQGLKCGDSMNCTSSKINQAYCDQIHPGTHLDNCSYTC